MQKAIDYRILRAPTIADLQREVTEHLNAGYLPLQGADHRPGDGWFQTVVKYAPEERVVTAGPVDDYTIPLDIDDAKALTGLLELDARETDRFNSTAVQGALHAIRSTLRKATRILG